MYCYAILVITLTNIFQRGANPNCLQFIIIIIIIITYLLIAIEFSLGSSSPYTSTDTTIKNKYT